MVTLGFALSAQPKISDDWYLIWNYQDEMYPINFMASEYLNWTGRVWMILLAAFVLPNPAVETAYRAFIVLEILLLIALAWYCASGPGAFRRTRENIQRFSIFGCLLWLALPVRDQTVAWLTGNFVYLVSALFGLMFMAWIERSLSVSNLKYNLQGWRHNGMLSLSFLIGLAAGVSQEQVVSACIAFFALTILRLKCGRSCVSRKIRSHIWIAAFGFILGVAILVCAPGNYSRIEKITSPSLMSVIERIFLYVPGAFFELGTGSTGKNIWLGVLIFILLNLSRLGEPLEMRARLKRAGFWWIVSLFSLLALAPVTNFISTRTSFFAVIFLFVGVAAMTRPMTSMSVDKLDISSNQIHINSDSRVALSSAVLIVLACLVFVEAIAALISNTSVAVEFSKRIEIVEREKRSTENFNALPIMVPFIATQPAVLTYLQSPAHDREFLSNWGMRINRPIVHDVTPNFPLPNSLDPIKAIKYRRIE